MDVGRGVGWVAVAAALGAGCLGASDPGDPPRPGPLWARANLAAVDGVPTDSSASLAVDPRPITIPEGPALPDASSYHPDREAGVGWFVDRLMAAGIDTVRSFPLNPECSGFLVPPPHKTVEGCPSSFQSEFIFDIAEPDDDGSLWTVRMLGISYTPGGRSVTLYRMVLEREGEVFRFLRLEPLIVFD